MWWLFLPASLFLRMGIFRTLGFEGSHLRAIGLFHIHVGIWFRCHRRAFHMAFRSPCKHIRVEWTINFFNRQRLVMLSGNAAKGPFV